jgi:hypothetical protein
VVPGVVVVGDKDMDMGDKDMDKVESAFVLLV